MKKLLMAAAALVVLAACARPPVEITKPEDALTQVSPWGGVAQGDDGGFKDIAAAARNSLAYYQRLPPGTVFSFGTDKETALDMIVTLQNFLLIIENNSLDINQKIALINRDFRFYRSVGSDGAGRVLFTGYYEPVLSCRLTRDATYRYPLYRKPDDLLEIDLSAFGNGFPRNRLFGRLVGKKVVPYYSREEIDQKNALAGKGLELLWCSDPVAIYLLQVQGSGKVNLGGGNMASVLYDGQNGWPYHSIGKYLIDQGAIPRDEMSMQAVRDYLLAHPETMNAIMDQNPSYVFFRVDTGPSVGSIGTALTPGRSIATDGTLFPKGALAYITTQKPIIEDGTITAWQPFGRFVVNQDTGGAIKGPGRVDLFCGQGADAELTAGNLQNEGKLYFLIWKKSGPGKE